MLEYFRIYYLQAGFGPGYIVTNVAYILGMVLLLNPTERTPKGIARKAADAAVWWLVTVVFCSVYYFFFGHSWMDRLMMAAVLAAYAVFRSRYRAITKVVRSCVYFTCTMLALPISEPIGKLFEGINESYTWAEHFTWVVVAALTALTLAFLLRFSTEGLSFIPTFPAVFVIIISGLGLLLQVVNGILEPGRRYNVIAAGCFWLLEVLSYYMFYIVSREYDQNLELLAMQHKMALDEDMLRFSRENYEEMHVIRHEMKNHLSYLRVLLERKEYGKLDEYLTTMSGETEKLFAFVECGNDVVNAVMNQAIKTASSRGVEVSAQIILPPELPYRETELCSLLSNLMDNAVEGAARSGREKPVVTVSIRPQQDYLFIRVTNPVDGSIPPGRLLSLRTTKQDAHTHGYGTKIIRSVAEHYQGSVKFHMQDELFFADVMLYLMEEENLGQAAPGNL